jgi:hypothetical protein
MPDEHVIKDNEETGHLATGRAWGDAAVNFLESSHERPFFLLYGLDYLVLANCDDSLSQDVMLDRGWGKLTLSDSELYDLVMDPNETCNLAVSSEHMRFGKSWKHGSTVGCRKLMIF